MTGNDATEREEVPGDPQETGVVAALVAGHQRFLAFLERRVGSSAEAEVILQEAFVRGIQRAGSVRESEAASAWFFRLLRNALIDHRRRAEGSFPGLSASEIELAEFAAGQSEDAAEACRCVLELADTLKPEYAAALRRVELEGRSIQDFAAEAGITPNNATVRLFRAREALRRRVHEACRTCAEHGCLDCTCGSSGTHG